jgi:hypothetical protein
MNRKELVEALARAAADWCGSVKLRRNAAPEPDKGEH